eukprot:TRINITY_DN3284_c1_g1_i2.p1 TRINITY_DN3284_c1_g1~~TRINITY_DN3284_c1_g1_i2.p1  ORF type:complete len:259 (-),score=41.95 TRINITY_DN3284_c1_g1_i2:461-1174(-)
MASKEIIASLGYCCRHLKKTCPRAAKYVANAMFSALHEGCRSDVFSGYPIALCLEDLIPDAHACMHEQSELVLDHLKSVSQETAMREQKRCAVDRNVAVPASSCASLVADVASQTEDVKILDLPFWNEFRHNVVIVGKQNEELRGTVESANEMLKGLRTDCEFWKLMSVVHRLDIPARNWCIFDSLPERSWSIFDSVPLHHLNVADSGDSSGTFVFGSNISARETNFPRRPLFRNRR